MKTLAVVATPHVGTLDSWFPVLAEARQKHPDWHLVVVLPRLERVAITLDPSDALLTAVEEIVDEILLFGLDGRFYTVASFRQLQQLADSQLMSARRLAQLPPLRGRVGALEFTESALPRTSRAARLYRVALRVVFSIRYHWQRIDEAGLARLADSVVCTDFTKANRGATRPALEAFGSSPRLSIEHGLGNDELPPKNAGTAAPLRGGGAESLRNLQRVYCHGEIMRDSMRTRYGVPAELLSLSGVPRHDTRSTRWLDLVAKDFRPESSRRYVVVISHVTTSEGHRPESPNDYLPARFKHRMLGAIHDAAEAVGAQVLIRLHPSENRAKALEEVRSAMRGKANSREGTTWQITNAHPQVLARVASTAVTFSSDLKVEFVACGVPVIDLHPGEPAEISANARGGLALVVHDVTGFDEAFARCWQSRDEVRHDQQSAYLARFTNPTGSVIKILREIEGLLSDESLS